MQSSLFNLCKAVQSGLFHDRKQSLDTTYFKTA